MGLAAREGRGWPGASCAREAPHFLYVVRVCESLKKGGGDCFLVDPCVLLLTEQLLQHPVENSRASNFAIPSAKTRHPRRTKLAAARSATANFARRLCRVFARGLAKFHVNFQQVLQQSFRLPYHV